MNLFFMPRVISIHLLTVSGSRCCNPFSFIESVVLKALLVAEIRVFVAAVIKWMQEVGTQMQKLEPRFKTKIVF